MKKSGRENRPSEKPVTHIELSNRYIKPRGFLALALLLLGMGFFGYAMMTALETEPGWQQVEVSSSKPNCGGEFTLMYDFGDDATAQYKRLVRLYSEAAENAFRIFTPDVQEDGLGNVAYLNAHINETVEVEPVLYRALSQVNAYSDRRVFLAPAAIEYNRVFWSQSDEEAASYDPAQNPETAAWVREVARFASDPQAVSLELLGNNQVRLKVSGEYQAFIRENELETILDFGWMTNAFIADYLADTLVENGFTQGHLSSYDGFTRNLDTRDKTYLFGLYNRQGTVIDMPAKMRCGEPMAIVFLRNYPMVPEDKWHYYAYPSGEAVTAMLDPADGMSKSAVNNLVAYSREQGCAEVLLQTAPIWIAEELQTEALDALAGQGVYAVWFEGETVKYTDTELTLWDANKPSSTDTP